MDARPRRQESIPRKILERRTILKWLPQLKPITTWAGRINLPSLTRVTALNSGTILFMKMVPRYTVTFVHTRGWLRRIFVSGSISACQIGLAAVHSIRIVCLPFGAKNTKRHPTTALEVTKGARLVNGKLFNKILPMKLKTFVSIIAPVWFVISLFWCANLVKLVNCDFKPSWKGEIIHTIGVFFPPACILTVWNSSKWPRHWICL